MLYMQKHKTGHFPHNNHTLLRNCNILIWYTFKNTHKGLHGVNSPDRKQQLSAYLSGC